jgi:hypothetical protein
MIVPPKNNEIIAEFSILLILPIPQPIDGQLVRSYKREPRSQLDLLIHIDERHDEERKPWLPFATQRHTLTSGQDDILAAERLARKRLMELQQ